MNKKQVFFPIYDLPKVEIFCRSNGLSFPVVYNTEGTNNYYQCIYSQWEILYICLPYAVGGCYFV